MKIQFESNELVIFESALYRTTSSLIIGDSYLLLVDPNWLPIELEFIKKYIQINCKNKSEYILFTHSDYDHIIGYGLFKEYKSIASQKFIDNTDTDKILNQIRKFDDEYYVNRNYKIEYPKIEISIIKEIEELKIGKDLYQFYQAPGHTKDSIIVYNKSKETVIVGDYLSNIEFPFIYHSWKSYLDTLKIFQKIINENPITLLITGHGDYTTDKNEMIKRIEDSRSYIEECLSSIKDKKNFQKQKLFEKYEFSASMKASHDTNMKLIENEITKS